MNRILIYRSGALGDFLLTLPAIAGIRQRWPEAALTLVSRPAYGELMLNQHLIHGFVSIDAALISQLFSVSSEPDFSAREWLQGFDRIFAWTTDGDGAFARNVSHATPAELLIMDPVLSECGMHASQQLGRTLPFSIPASYTFPARKVEKFTQRPVIAVHAGSGSVKKNLPVEMWRDFLVRGAQIYPELQFLLITGEADESASAGLCSIEIPWLREISNASLSDLTASLQQCQGFIGHDTGVAHLAGVCGLPSLVWFGLTDPKIWAPTNATPHFSKTCSEWLAQFEAWFRDVGRGCC